MRNRETIFIQDDISWTHPKYVKNRIQLESWKHFRHDLSSVGYRHTCVLNQEIFDWCIDHIDEWIFWTRKICWISFQTEADMLAFKLRWL